MQMLLSPNSSKECIFQQWQLEQTQYTMSREDPAINKEGLANKKDYKLIGGRRHKSSEDLTLREQPQKDERP